MTKITDFKKGKKMSASEQMVNTSCYNGDTLSTNWYSHIVCFGTHYVRSSNIVRHSCSRKMDKSFTFSVFLSRFHQLRVIYYAIGSWYVKYHCLFNVNEQKTYVAPFVGPAKQCLTIYTITMARTMREICLVHESGCGKGNACSVVAFSRKLISKQCRGLFTACEESGLVSLR